MFPDAILHLHHTKRANVKATSQTTFCQKMWRNGPSNHYKSQMEKDTKNCPNIKKKKKMSFEQYVECCLQTQSISICTKQEKYRSISNHEANAGVVEDKQSVGEVCKRQHLSEEKILRVNSLLPSVDYCSMERKDINKRKRVFKQFA